MKRTLCIILCLIMSITGCSTVRNTTNNQERSSQTEPASDNSASPVLTTVPTNTNTGKYTPNLDVTLIYPKVNQLL